MFSKRTVVFLLLLLGMSVLAWARNPWDTKWDDCKRGSGDLQCCEDAYDNSVETDCYNNSLWGPIMSKEDETEFENNIRYASFVSCLESRRILLEGCVVLVTQPNPGQQCQMLVEFLGGNSFILATHPFGSGLPNSITFQTQVSQGNGGPWALHLLNGGPDDTIGPKGRVIGTVTINGVVVVDANQLNSQNHRLAVPVILNEGSNTITFSISKTDNAWFGHLKPYLAKNAQ